MYFLLFMSCIFNVSITLEQLKATLDEKLTPIKSKIDELRSKVTEAMKFITLASSKYDELLTKFAIHDKENKELIKENQILRGTVRDMESKLSQLSDTCNDLEQYSRRDCVEILGIPFHRDEDTNKIVRNVGNLIGVHIEEKDISISHRLPTRKLYRDQGNVYNNSAIIVKFLHHDVKEQLYQARARIALKSCTSTDI